MKTEFKLETIQSFSLLLLRAFGIKVVANLVSRQDSEISEIYWILRFAYFVRFFPKYGKTSKKIESVMKIGFIARGGKTRVFDQLLGFLIVKIVWICLQVFVHTWAFYQIGLSVS